MGTENNTDHLRRLLTNYYRRLQKLKELKAVQGLETPASTLLEIEDIENEIEKLQEQLYEIADSGPREGSKESTSFLHSYFSHSAAKDFFYKLGNIEIPVNILVGDPESPFSMNEVHIDYNPTSHYQRPDYPIELERILPYIEKHQVTSGMRNNLLARLNHITRPVETQEDKRGEITLHLAQTDFFRFLTTNRALDDYPLIPNLKPDDDRKQTIREAFTSSSYTLRNFVLANPISAHVVLISQNINQNPSSQVIIQKRTKYTHSFHDWYLDSAAGYTNISHQDESGNPNPFVTAVAEARHEIASLVLRELDPQDYKLIGIAVNWEDLDINAYGFINTNSSVRELLGDYATEGHEGRLEAIRFDPREVLEHIANHKWEPVSALNMCQTLIANFPPKQVIQKASEVIPKNISDFFSNQ